MLIVQHIKTLWTKASRGMPDAAKRNAVPRQLILPSGSMRVGGMLVHEVSARELDDFRPHQAVDAFDTMARYRSLDFHWEHKSIQVLFTYSALEFGRPNRGAYRKLLFKLAPGETGALHINGRFTTYSGQFYMQHVMNIGHVLDFSPRLFVEKAFHHCVDKRVHLF